MKHGNDGALLDTLLSATVESSDNPRPLTDQEIRDNLLAILVNGHQTVAVSVAMTLYALARRPDEARAVREEIDRAFLASGGQPTAPAISRLEYLGAVI